MRALALILTAAAILAACTFHATAPAASAMQSRAATLESLAQ